MTIDDEPDKVIKGDSRPFCQMYIDLLSSLAANKSQSGVLKQAFKNFWPDGDVNSSIK